MAILINKIKIWTKTNMLINIKKISNKVKIMSYLREKLVNFKFLVKKNWNKEKLWSRLIILKLEVFKKVSL